MLAGMLLPAVQNAREAGRRAVCINNQKNVALALINYMETRKAFPMGRNIVPISTTNASLSNQQVTHVGWQVMILPYLDSVQIWDNLKNATDTTTNESVRKPQNVKLPFYWCPSAGRQEAGQVSYVVNAGYNDMPWGFRKNELNTGVDSAPFSAEWKAATATEKIVGEIGKFNGLFIDGKDPKYGSPIGIEDIKDGATNTMLVSENLQFNHIWATAEVLYGFCWPYYKNSSENSWHFNDTYNCTTLAGYLAYDPQDGGLSKNDFYTKYKYYFHNTPMRINRCAQNLDGHRAWLTARPSSAHPGSVIVAFADGSARVVREDLDNLLYISAMAPNDQKCHCASDMNRLFMISDLD